MIVAVRGVAFRDVRRVEHRLGGQQVEAADGRLFFGRHLEEARGLAVGEQRLEAFEQAHFQLRLRVAGFRGFLRLVEAAFDAGEVGEREFDRDDLAVAHRIGRAHHVLDVGVLEAADDVDDRVHFADVGEELVAEAFTLAGAFDQAGDVEEFDSGRHRALRADDLRERVQARVGHRHDAGVRLDGGEGIVGDERAGRRQRVEEGGLADVG